MRKCTTLMITAAILLAAPALAFAQDFDPTPMADTNSDGVISLEEFKGFREQAWSFLANGADKVKVSEASDMAKDAFKGAPTDADGVLTHDAWTAAGDAAYKAADTNGDGKVSADEFRKFMAPSH